MPHMSTFLTTYKVGDIVDIKANASEQKGMPHKYYHGKTGIVYNVTPRGVGVICYKVVNGRYMEKRVNLRVEHVKHSGCRQEFLDRVKSNAQKKKEAKAAGGEFIVFRMLTTRSPLPRSPHRPEAKARSASTSPPRLVREQRRRDPVPHGLRNHHLNASSPFSRLGFLDFSSTLGPFSLFYSGLFQCGTRWDKPEERSGGSV
jgi:ribosomal protein L21E